MTAARDSEPHVIVGVDGSPESVEALAWAASYAAATGATISAVYGWHHPDAQPVPDRSPQPGTDQIKAVLQDTLDRALTQVFGTAKPDKVDAKIVYGHPAMVLINESESADLLVVGSRGQGAFHGMQLGSVSIHCVTNASCPVVVVRGKS
jgi:nucleotide-binding universal stress UspA family protein